MLVLGLLMALPASANERRFTYTYESATLPQGERELEVWTTARIKREGFYSRFDNRLEFEVGLTDRLMTAFYLNSSAVTAPTGVGHELSSEFEFTGVSSEWKYKLLDPVADVFGLSVYGELSAGPREAEVEARIILDKKIGRNLFALNLVAEPEWEWEESDEVEQETGAEVNLAYAFFLTDHLSVGAEVRNHTVFEGDEVLSALYAGPVVSYATRNFWVTATVLPQITALSKAPDAPAGPFELEDHERFNARLLFSFFL